MITRERFVEIFNQNFASWEGDNALQGLLIIAKYFNYKEKDCLVDAGHEIIYSVSVDDIIEAGITEEDANKLKELNWMIDSEHDSLACFV